MQDGPHLEPTPRWAGPWLRAAAVYNFVWGALVIAFPHLLFDLAGMERMRHPEIWQCVGMIVGVYGVGYSIAAADPRTHWPIVLVGLLGKVLGPMGFAVALLDGRFPPLFGLTILTNDLVWWIPFALILRDARRHQLHAEVQRPPTHPTSEGHVHYVKESRIAAPPEDVFRFHESPGALQQLTPPWESVEVVESDGSLKPGSRVVIKTRQGLISVRWVAVHTEYDPPHMFADRQESGPFAFWYHRHRFLDDGEGGTLLRDEVEYRPPLGFLGRWFAGWFIRRKLERMFAHRHEVTRRLVESGVWEDEAGDEAAGDGSKPA